MKSPLFHGLIHPVCFMLLAAVGCAPKVATETKLSQKAVAVKAVTVIAEDVSKTTRQPATVLPLNEAEIRAKAFGYVTELAVDIGDFVKQGETLAVIAVPEVDKQLQVLKAQIEHSEAKEQQAQAGVQLAQAGIESAKATLQQSKSALQGVKAAVAAAEAEFDRTSDLVDRQSLQGRMLDEVRKKRDSEVANESSAESAINASAAKVTVAEAQLAAARADLAASKSDTEVAKKRMEETEVLLGYATLKAPFDGVITSRTVDLGDLVQPESQIKPLFVVSQIGKVRVQMPVPEGAAASVNPGDKVTLSFPSFEGEPAIESTITRAAGSLDSSTRTMLVETEVENKENKLIPGMFGQATITLSSNTAANMLPARAIRFDESGQAYVYAIGEDSTVSVVNVTTGMDDGSSVEIVEGVSVGQLVIDAHLKRFKTGQKVAPLN